MFEKPGRADGLFNDVKLHPETVYLVLESCRHVGKLFRCGFKVGARLPKQVLAVELVASLELGSAQLDTRSGRVYLRLNKLQQSDLIASRVINGRLHRGRKGR